MNAYESLQQRHREIALYNSTASMLSWDQETYMPESAGAYRAEQLSHLAGLTHRLATSPEVDDWIKACEDSLPVIADEEETALRAANVREWRRDYDRATKLPRGRHRSPPRPGHKRGGNRISRRSSPGWRRCSP
jgi:carboxypeptidase Taq